MVLKKSAPDPENETTSNMRVVETATERTNNRQKASQSLRLNTKDSDTTPPGYINRGARLSFGEPHMLYDGSPSDTPCTVLRITKAHLTPIEPTVLDRGNSTEESEGAIPSSRRKPRKSIPQMGKPPLEVLERQKKLEQVEVPSSTSQRRRRRRKNAQAEELARTNPAGKVVSESIRENPKEVETSVKTSGSVSEEWNIVVDQTGWPQCSSHYVSGAIGGRDLRLLIDTGSTTNL